MSINSRSLISGSVGIIGAGIMGRLLALELHRRGWKVALFEAGDRDGSQSCSHVAAGMLSPYCEREEAEEWISLLGRQSLSFWPRILEEFEEPVFFQLEGSLVVAHPADASELDRLPARIPMSSDPGVMRKLSTSEIDALEPELSGRFRDALFFPQEGQIDSREALRALAAALEKKNVPLHWGMDISHIAPREIAVGPEKQGFDWVVDCRGLRAKAELRDLRGVRGEIVAVETDEIHFHRPIRLVHPRYSIYVVPRPKGRYLIGATMIESEDQSPISVRSLLELLTAAYSIHPGFAEANVLETNVQWRPAFADNAPRVRWMPGLVHVNGLYRHGFLLSPRIAQLTAQLIETGTVPSEALSLFSEQAP